MENLKYKDIDENIMDILRSPTRAYYIMMGCLFLVLLHGIGCWVYLIYTGFGVTGLNNPVGWGTLITNFVFWVGIAHAGTLISAILFLLRARYRTSIFRAAEAMTVFAVFTAGLFPLIHVGRVWNFYWLIPYPNQRLLWVNFKSPLVWDVFAVSTYLTVSSTFLFIGMIPDNGIIRDYARGWRKKFHALFAFGWRGTHKQWHHYYSAYLFLAALVTPLVLSVHSVVSWDFAMSIVPGWHSTIFAPYFVAGAIFSGVAMVGNILVPLRKMFRLEKYITDWHFDNMAKLVLFTSTILFYSYAVEFFLAWYSDNPFEQAQFWYRAFGDYWFEFWLMVFGNCLFPMLFWIKYFRVHRGWFSVICVFVNIGMWLERFNIIVISLSKEYEPYAWGLYTPSYTEIGLTLGAFAWFGLWLFSFIKLFPSLPIAELKEMLKMPKKEAR
ncbi:MAG: polysulfide reductase NrfD [Nitrospinae bacterium]|nr:polysulfide reductase NrfD [Nitrospinota bacterium]